MEIGCGFRVREIKGHEYVYFWRYEDRGGRSHQVHVYVGPRRSAATSGRLTALLESYYARAGQQLARDLADRRQAAATLR
jgi:hypothetical protein